MNWDRRWLRQMDWLMLLLLFVLMVFGLVMIESATSSLYGASTSYLIKQAAGIGLGLLLLALIVWVDYTEFARYEKLLYGLMCGLLILVHFVGTIKGGSQRWIVLGPIQLQPSEPAKFLFILTMASFLSRREGRMGRWVDLITPAIFAGIPFALVAVQPDLGTGLVFVVIALSMVYMAGASGSKLLLGLVLGVGLVVGVVWAELHFGWNFPLHDYQIRRLTTFLNNTDKLKDGYQVWQSQLSIGSGGLWGKGLHHSVQAQLGYLSEGQTDMIFAVVGEELGFVGGTALMGIFLLLILRMYRTALNARDLYGRLIVTGAASMFTFHVVQNMGMAMGVMPVAGIPLPFISYGPSATVTNLMACALVFSVGLRSRSLNF